MKMIINGKYLEKENNFSIKNPANNQIVDTVPLADIEDAKRAVESAHKAGREMREMSSRKVSRILGDIYEGLSENLKLIAKLITLETGKPIKDSVAEMERSLQTLLFAAEESKRIYGEVIPLDSCIGAKNVMGFTKKIPLGVITAITPFNYPVNLALHKIAPAIAAKNTVVFKPSLKAPLAAMKMAEIMNNHLPPGVINAITGKSNVIGDELVTNPLVEKISFTGSVETGKSIAHKAGMKRLTLELGGNDPLIVLGDANIDQAVDAAISGSYLIAGQVCIAIKRIIIQEEIAQEFTEKLVEKTRELKMGDPLDPKTDIGPLIDENAAQRVDRLVKMALDEGAEILCGGNRDGAFYEPTVLDHVKPTMEIVQNETFGPISPLIHVSGLKEAVKVANSTIYGLQAGVFTENIEKAKIAAKSIEAGTVLINKQPTFRTDNMPFGGFKMSGVGKEGVKYSMEDMTRTKLIIIG